MSLDLAEERGHFLDRVMKAKSTRHAVELAMETSHHWEDSVHQYSCREEERETVTHFLLMISTPETSLWSFWLPASGSCWL